MEHSLEGIWEAELSDGTRWSMKLPGTLDENRIGHKDSGANQWHPDAALGNAVGSIDEDAPIATRFTRRCTYEGEVRISRTVVIEEYGSHRLFLKAERARLLRLFVDDIEYAAWRQGTLSTPYIYELTGLTPGEHIITFISDNSYPGMPKEAICYSSAATDETQTNWNGILGEIKLYTTQENFISDVHVYPHASDRIKGACDSLDAEVIVSVNKPCSTEITLKSEVLENPAFMNAEFGQGENKFRFNKLKLTENVHLWDEGEGNLYELMVSLMQNENLSRMQYGSRNKTQNETKSGTQNIVQNEAQSKFQNIAPEIIQSDAEVRIRHRTEEENYDEYTVTLGIRHFGDNGSGRLALNGRTIFLRSEANCAEFPETGHAPMTVAEWEDILLRYRSYGINCVRFHSHCPPEAAFTAADKLGMLMQPELSNWNPRDAFESDESYSYYKRELEGILNMLANHPSFVMLTFGNELQAKDKGRERMSSLLSMAKEVDATRLYAKGSNIFYGEEGCDKESDFYTSQSCHDVVIRGTFSGMRGYINEKYPSALTDYDAAMKRIRQEYAKPVFSFEVGQFEVLPDFRELEMFQGISEPANLRIIEDKVKERGLMSWWHEYVEATGELALLAYREEIEAAMRTRELSGISLLGLQDFPGQGTALVGMMNSHLMPKPYDFARPERFRAFFKEAMPLVKLPRYTYEAGERLIADVVVANFGKEDIEGELRYRIDYRGCAVNSDEKREGFISGSLGDTLCRRGGHTCVGTIDMALDFIGRSTALILKVEIISEGRSLISSEYPIWVYKKVEPACPENVYETRIFDDKAKEVLRCGGRVYLSPDADKDSMPASIKTQFTTDFWSVGTFSDQEGGMGELIDVSHPIFREFPTDKHTDWQWWIMATKRAVILPRTMKAIVTEMDSYAFLRPMAQLIEFRCMGGKVLLSAMELHNSQKYPEARALQAAIYEYMAGDEFEPAEELTEKESDGLFRKLT